MANYTLNVGIMYFMYLLTVAFVKLFTPRNASVALPDKFRLAFKKDSIYLLVLMVLEAMILLAIVFKSSFIHVFFYSIPDFLRTTGVVLGYLGTLFISLTLLKIKKVYSATLNLRNDHELVKDGIYRYIRHPIYTGFVFLHVGVTFALSNILVAFVWIGGLFVFLYHRIPNEEALLEDYFKEEYLNYKTTTGMLFPKFLKKRIKSEK